MNRLAQLYRLLHIQFVFARHGLDKIVLSIPLLAPLQFLAYLNPWNWHKKGERSRGERIRNALEELGPIFVKFGQMLSTRRDLLPVDIADELARLQDQVPPFSGERARAIVESVYGCSWSMVFAVFDVVPLASASIAQVHAATLLDGKEVVVKIVRPTIKKLIRRDVALLYAIAGLVERCWSEGPRLHPREVVAEFEKYLFNELDLLREAANASQLRRNFLNSPLLYIPEVYWEYTRQDVMVMERIEGIPISNVQALKDCEVDLKKLAGRGVEIFFTQVFRDCFFHADMHPGNIFVSIKSPQDPQYLAVDFGIMGSLSPSDQRYLAENLLAFFRRDYRRVAQLHVESGWVPLNTRLDEFEAAVRAVCEPMFERPLKDVSFGRMLLQLFQVARHFQMEVQPQLLLLQKTLFNIEGLGRQLYPELDLWVTAKPFLERWVEEQLGPKAVWRKIRDNVPYWAEKLPEMPGLIYETLRLVRENTLVSHWQKAHLLQRRKVYHRVHGLSFLLGIGVAVIIGVGGYFFK